MNPTLVFLAALALALSVAAATLTLIQRPLAAVLCELCGGAQRARLWTRLHGLGLFLGVLLFALWAPPDEAATQAGLSDFLATLRAGTLGLLLGLGLLALVTLRSIARFDRPRLEAGSRPVGGE